MRKGKFIVFEGIDGSGKTTQAKLLYSRLKEKKIPTSYISFPRYTASMWGAMVRRYLNGDFGKLDPYLASMLYAGDRASAGDLIRKWIKDGKIVVCDRYIASNIGHQAGKIKNEKKRDKFIKWLEELEYGENKIPREDVVIFLNIGLSDSLALMKSRKRLDIHESDNNHLKNAMKVYLNFAKKRKYWKQVDCIKGGKLMSVNDVEKKVLNELRLILEKDDLRNVLNG